MKKTGLNDFKKYLSKKNTEELKFELLSLYKSFSNIQEYYTSKINPDFEKDIFLKYKKIIENEFFPRSGDPKYRYSIMNKALSDFKKCSNNKTNIADLMIAYTEYGIQFTNEYGDIDQYFYNKIASTYNDALKYIFENNLENQFNNRILEIFNQTRDFAWGFSQEISNIFFLYYKK